MVSKLKLIKMKVGVAGASGRMGKGIVRAISQSDDMELTLATDLEEVGVDAGKIAGIKDIGINIISPNDLEKKRSSVNPEPKF